jgi:hypothetical protein
MQSTWVRITYSNLKEVGMLLGVMVKIVRIQIQADGVTESATNRWVDMQTETLTRINCIQ